MMLFMPVVKAIGYDISAKPYNIIYSSLQCGLCGIRHSGSLLLID